jgi:hypothetical protein
MYIEIKMSHLAQVTAPDEINKNPQSQDKFKAQKQPKANPTQAQFQKEELFPGVPKPLPKKTIFAWEAPSRPFKTRDRRYYQTVILIVFLISLILFFAGQFLPIAVVISVGFLAYVLSSVPPHNVRLEINTYGVEIEDTLYYWEEMGRFWFDRRYDQEILTIEVARFPGRLVLLFNPQKKEDLKTILAEVLLEQKPEDNFYDQASKWLQEKLPLEVGS